MIPERLFLHLNEETKRAAFCDLAAHDLGAEGELWMGTYETENDLAMIRRMVLAYNACAAIPTERLALMAEVMSDNITDALARALFRCRWLLRQIPGVDQDSIYLILADAVLCEHYGQEYMDKWMALAPAETDDPRPGVIYAPRAEGA